MASEWDLFDIADFGDISNWGIDAGGGGVVNDSIGGGGGVSESAGTGSPWMDNLFGLAGDGLSAWMGIEVAEHNAESQMDLAMAQWQQAVMMGLIPRPDQGEGYPSSPADLAAIYGQQRPSQGIDPRMIMLGLLAVVAVVLIK